MKSAGEKLLGRCTGLNMIRGVSCGFQLFCFTFVLRFCFVIKNFSGQFRSAEVPP